MIRMTLNTSTALQYAMPIISKKKYTFWCQDCNAVFDELTKANEHREGKPQNEPDRVFCIVLIQFSE